MKQWDEIRIEELEVFAHHGVFPEEKEKGQSFLANATLYTDLRKAGQKDDLTLSTHYGEVSLLLDSIIKENTYDLIETVAEHCAREILLQFPLVRALDLEIRKPDAPIPLPFSSVSVKIYRAWHSAYIAFGSNLGESRKMIEDAISAMKKDVSIQVDKVSSMIVTKPYGGVEQPDFLNGVLHVRTLYEPEELLEKLHELEQAAGRTREIHWGPRTLDLDILLYDDLIYESETLIIPHVDMQNRDFVLMPMAEIAGFKRHPILHKTMSELLQELDGRKG